MFELGGVRNKMWPDWWAAEWAVVRCVKPMHI